MIRRALSAAVLALLTFTARDLSAQTLSGKIAEMIRFGNCAQSLCLVTGAGPHESHYIEAARLASEDLVSFLTNSITTSIGSLPISSTSGGTTFSFVGGAPVRSTTSAGPIFAERASTLGKGRLLAGVNTTGLAYKKLRGEDISDLTINLGHQDVGNPGLGDVEFENDIIGISLDMELTLQVTTLFATYGLTDRLDVSVALPFVMANFDGEAEGLVYNPTGSVSGVHFFGSASSPSLTASSEVDGSSSGIGDIAVRAKFHLTGSNESGTALLADVRLPTGDDEQFLGAGALSASGQFVASTTRGKFSPHLNVGYALRTGDEQTGAMVGTVGFDYMISRPATIAIDLLSSFQVGENKQTLPPTIELQNDEIEGTNIPDEKDNPIGLSVGGRFLLGSFTLVTNGLFPLKAGGMQASFAWTLGLERTF
jgi:hypothetical protein